MKKTLFILACVCSLFIISCEKDDHKTGETAFPKEEIQCDPLYFNSVQSLNDAVNNWSGYNTKAQEGFSSYAETVMRQDGYDDEPWALASEAFGSILNPAGEVLFEDKMLKLCQKGTLVGPVSMMDEIRALSSRDDLFALCGEETDFPYSDYCSSAYPIKGQEGIYLIDTFSLKQESAGNGDLATKATDVYMHEFFPTTSSILGKDANGNIRWNHSFTVPASGSQKTLFNDTHYCNDTKFYQQNYGVSGSGLYLKTKTMKRGLFWSKFANLIEGRFMSIVAIESGTYPVNGTDVNLVTYSDASFYVVTVNARNLGWQAVAQKTDYDVLQDIAAAKAELQASFPNINISIAGIRYITSNTQAATRFPDITIGPEVLEKIDYRFLLRLGGSFTTGASQTGQNYYNNISGEYHLATLTVTGRSFRGDEIRGSGVLYTYDYD